MGPRSSPEPSFSVPSEPMTGFPPRRSPDEPLLVELRDGSRALLRPIAPEDKALVADAFARLSPASRRRRFLGPADRLTGEDLAYLTEVDHRRHDALIALDAATGEALGEARYVRTPGHGETAEVAVAVADGWQGRGLATALLTRLTERARKQGLREYTGLVSSDNAVVLDMLERLGARRRPQDDADGEVAFAIELPETDGIGDRLRHALRGAATGQLEFAAGIARRLRLRRGG